MKYLFLNGLLLIGIIAFSQSKLQLSSDGSFRMHGLDINVFADVYPEGHQTGVTVIQHGERVAANGDIRLEVSPGQWSPIPKAGKQIIDTKTNSVSRELWFPDSSRNRKGFNPIIYPDLSLYYTVKVTALEGSSFKITVDLNKAIPEDWIGKIGFNFELFPTHLFGKSYIMDNQTGIFTQQANGPIIKDFDEYIAMPLAEGKQLTIVPENDLQRIRISTSGKIGLYDGRANHNNGWFIVRELIPANATKNAIEWIVTPNVVQNWKYEPVIHISQIGYHPLQAKKAVIETDKTIGEIAKVTLIKLTEEGRKTIKTIPANNWGNFLRYNYFIVDFTDFKEEGMYILQLGNTESNPFKIDRTVFQKHVWQPVIEYFLPVQMCHMRVNEKYRVWHDACHLDDALMAPTDFNHFDGYVQGSSTLCKHKPFEQIKGLNEGGWHDAGDYDLRVESQIGEISLLSMMIEEFDLYYDATTVDWENRIVEIHQPDGVNDVVQQIEHGLRSVLGAYRSLGRLYRGIICPTLRQYALLGDGAAMTDNLRWNNTMPLEKRDDRLVFTENNPYRECKVGAGLAVASRALAKYNRELSAECLETALALWETSGKNASSNDSKIEFAAELLLSTGNQSFAEEIYKMEETVLRQANRIGWVIGKALPVLKNANFNEKMAQAIKSHAAKVSDESKKSPFGVPYRPNIWGDGWTIQRFGVEQYFVHKAWPKITTPDYYIDALNFVLGVHPGQNTASFASGVGSNSATVAYGVNRADWSYIPGGVVSGTAMIRPDLPEFKIWPYFWQQTEYVMGGGSTNFMFLTLAVDKYFNK